MMESILEVKNLTKNYSGFTLDHISFSIPYGTIMGLIGENGAGKSTTISSILQLISKDDGEVTIFGGPFTEQNHKMKQRIGVVFDSDNFYETLTPHRIGHLLSKIYDNWDTSLFQSYLQRFELPENKELKQFSKGMRMKFNITTALSHKPDLLILDEATSGLDPIVRDEMLDLFLEFVQDERHSILLSSHITTDLEKVADYITFLHKGNLVFCETKDDLLYQYGIMKCGADVFARMDPTDVLRYRKRDYAYEVLVADKKKAASKYPSGIMDQAAVDDIMLLYVKGESL